MAALSPSEQSDLSSHLLPLTSAAASLLLRGGQLFYPTDPSHHSKAGHTMWQQVHPVVAALHASFVFVLIRCLEKAAAAAAAA
jgi:hypothetical protein